MSKQEEFHLREQSPEKIWEVHNKATLSKKKEKKYQYKSEVYNSVRHPAELSNILAWTYHH